MKRIVRKGEDTKIECPITGTPIPIIEWYKGPDIIDYSWFRIRTVKKAMKIKKTVKEDMGVYWCKGVNGFGNTQVRVDLIVIGRWFFCCFMGVSIIDFSGKYGLLCMNAYMFTKLCRHFH